jgi:hypothetical protein
METIKFDVKAVDTYRAKPMVSGNLFFLNWGGGIASGISIINSIYLVVFLNFIQ